MVYFIIFNLFLIPIIKGASAKNNLPNKYYWFLCVVITLVAGLRNTVGGDTIGYMHDWENNLPTISELNPINIAFMSQWYRPLILTLWVICKSIWNEFYCIQIVTSIIVNFSAFYIIQKESNRKYEVVMLFLIFQYLYFNTEIMRESVAISVFYFAFKFYNEKKWTKYYILTIITFLIHDSAFLLMFLPFVHKYVDRNLSLGAYFRILILSMIIFNPLLLNYLVMLLPGNRGSSFLEGYGAMENATIFGTIRSFLTILLNFYIFQKVRLKQSVITQKGFTVYLLLSCLGLLLPIFSIRLRNYIMIFSWFVYADFLVLYKRDLMQKVLCVLLIFNFYRYYFMDVSDWIGKDAEAGKYYFYERYFPYSSIFEEPDQDAVNRRTAIYYQNGNRE